MSRGKGNKVREQEATWGSSAGRKEAMKWALGTPTRWHAIQGRAPAWDRGDLAACPLSALESLCDCRLVTNPCWTPHPHLYVDKCELESFKGLSVRLSWWSLETSKARAETSLQGQARKSGKRKSIILELAHPGFTSSCTPY